MAAGETLHIRLDPGLSSAGGEVFVGYTTIGFRVNHDRFVGYTRMGVSSAPQYVLVVYTTICVSGAQQCVCP